MEAKIVRCQMNSANILEYFYKDGVLIKNQTDLACAKSGGVLPNKGVGGHPQSKRASEAEEGRAPQREGTKGPAPRRPFEGWGAVLIRLRQTRAWARFPR